MRAAISSSVMLALFAAVGAASASECNVELKPSDGYKELSAKLKCLNDKIKVLEGSTPAPSGSVAKAPPRAKVSGAASAGHYQLELLKCSKVGSVAIKCNLTITSTGKDGRFSISDGSRLFDLQGREFNPSARDIAGGNPDGKELIADVPTPASISFKIDDTVNGISSLRISVYGAGVGSETVSFRSVAIQ